MRAIAAGLLTLMVGTSVLADDVVNIYSSRHYDTDEAFYQNFTKQTGITVNRIDGKADELIERILAEGEASPADILITVDAGRLWRATEAEIFAPVESEILTTAIPATMRDADNLWFGFSKRVRMIIVNPDLVDPAAVQNYEDLTSEAAADQVCIRSSSNIYQLSLMATLIEHLGEAEAQSWAEGVVGNFAREPEGNDTAQIRAVASGECGVALANSYYLARLGNSDDADDRAVFDKVAYVFPNQDNRGAHVNFSGAGMVKGAPNAENAIKFLEYMASPEAQAHFANGNNEYPVVDGVEIDNPSLDAMGAYEEDKIDLGVYGRNQALAQLLYDAAGWR